MTPRAIALAALVKAKRAADKPPAKPLAPLPPLPAIAPTEAQILAAVEAVLANLDLRGPRGLPGDDAKVDEDEIKRLIDEAVKKLPKPKINVLEKPVFQMRTNTVIREVAGAILQYVYLDTPDPLPPNPALVFVPVTIDGQAAYTMSVNSP